MFFSLRFIVSVVTSCNVVRPEMENAMLAARRRDVKVKVINYNI